MEPSKYASELVEKYKSEFPAGWIDSQFNWDGRTGKGENLKAGIGKILSYRKLAFCNYAKIVLSGDFLEHDVTTTLKQLEEFFTEEIVPKGKDTRNKLLMNYSQMLLKFEGEGINEKGIVVSGPENLVGKTVVAVSEDFYRPTDVVNLWGDPTKAKAKLGWNPAKTTFEQLVQLMVEHDIAKVAAEGAAAKVRTNLAEYLEKGIVK